MNLEEVHRDYGRFKKRAKELQKWINEEFSEEKQLGKLVSLIDYDNHAESVAEIESLFKQVASG